ncbi:transglycosylase [Paenibacillus selenitireducens]|uniref:Transglycosylase n=1 Tax=Paenibacillus selenitireducens TaxID=1324314 RepID=A0A1T2XC50_9BACL|nr:transglycosylase [Paenibacillus selenitireducens]OPA77471.1 transglycosylase [Paenibacillus selenitireducens]
MTELNKDVVGAKINLDVTKILPAFKAIDEGARGNAASFQSLNAELAITQKNFASMGSAADKFALTSEERRKKILAESEALIKQRLAQTELINAKKNQLDQTNNIVESKLKAQQAIVKKREDAIEQQEREHQLKMAALQQKTSAASGLDNLMQAKIDRQFQIMKNGDAKLEMEAERHAAKMQILNQSALSPTKQTQPLVSSENIFGRIEKYAEHAVVFHTITTAINTAQHALKEGLVGIETNMAGYVQTNEHYFLEYNAGTKEMVMNTEKLHDETTKFLHTAHDLGSEIMDVTESARLWGRMYKDVNVVQELVRQSTALSTVDMVELEASTKSMESVMAQYAVHIQNANDAMVIGNRVLDSWSKVAHDTMAPARDLGAAFERTGKIAAETGVSFDFMNGLISTGIRNTALSGENLGNMWKTVLGTIRTEKAVNEIERLGVKTTELVDGTEQWRKAEDILLDLSTKVIDKNYDLTQSYADISRGVYQFAKLAASLNAGDILLGTATSIGSTGSTMEYLKVQMDTIQRKAAQAKASLLEVFNNAGDDGLRRSIKDVLDVIDRLLIGLTKLPKGTLEVAAGIGGLIVVTKSLQGVLNLTSGAIAALSAIKSKNTIATVANTAATVANTTTNQANVVATEGVILSTVSRTAATEGASLAQTTLSTTTKGAAVATGILTTAQAALSVTMAAATAGLSLVMAGLAAFAFMSGKAEKAERDRIQAMKDEDSASQQMISQYERQIELLPKLVNAHVSLENSLKSGTFSSEKQIQVKKQLDEVSKALVVTLGEEGAKQLDAAKYTDEAVRIQIQALNDLIVKQQEARKNVLLDQQDEITKQQVDKQKELKKALKDLEDAQKTAYDPQYALVQVQAIEKLREKVQSLEKESHKLDDAMAGVSVQIGQLAVDSIDQFSGAAGKATESVKDQEDALSYLRDEIKDNTSAISELNQVSHDLSKGQSMNAESATELILKYPQLADKIYKVADGWKFETGAVDILRKAKIQKAIDDLKSEQDSQFNTKVATDARLQSYGIEAQAIKSLADLKAKLNSARTNDLSSGDDLKYFKPAFKQQGLGVMGAKEAAESDLDSILNEYEKDMKAYDDKIKSLSKLYNDPKFGVSKDSSKEKSKSKKDDPLAKAFDASSKYIEHQKAIGKLNTSQELTAWQRVQSQYAQGTEQRMKADEKVYALKKTLSDEAQKKEKEAYNASINWISHQKGIREVSAAQELDMLLRVQSRYKVGSEERMQLDEKVYAARKAKDQEYFADFQRQLSHKKAMEQISTEDEIKAWIKIQGMYKEGTDQRMQADEQLYTLKKKLLDDEQKAVGDYTKTTKTILDQSKNDAIKRIEEERDAFLASQDLKIKAIDDEIKKMDEANNIDDYERALAEKKARLELLQSAVGPEGIKEREQVQKDIEEMERKHQREQAKKSLEDQKQQLQDEKTQKENDYNDQIQKTKEHYDQLSNAFDTFSSQIEFKAEDLKQLQILKESEKNEEILKQLDQFILDYQARMGKISSVSASISQRELDLQEYNSNKDAFDAAKARGDQAEMARLSSRNQQIRDQYGIKQDTGKLQHFKNGGLVQGQRGEAVPVVAHAGEMFLNESQQGVLFKLLNFNFPQLSFSMPQFSMNSGSGQSVTNYNYYSVSSGDVHISDDSTARTFWSEKDNLVRRMQSKGGKRKA